MAVRSLAQSSLRQNPQLNSMLAGYQPNAFHHLETVRLGGNVASVTFSNLARYSDYQHFQIRGVARCTNNSSLAALIMRFNGDSGANYAQHSLEGVNNAMATNGTPNNSSFAFYIPGNQSNSGVFAPFITDILDPFQGKAKTARTFSGFNYTGNWQIAQLTSGLHFSSAQLSSILIAPNQNEFLSGSKFSLYGIKATA